MWINRKKDIEMLEIGKVLAVTKIENAKNLIKKRKLKFLRTETTYKDKKTKYHYNINFS